MHNVLLKIVPVFLYAVTMLIFYIKRIISSEKWLNYVVTFFSFFFFENAKNLGRSDDAKRRKNRGCLIVFSPEVRIPQRNFAGS